MALESNSTFGNYRIHAVIGEGGMGQVYLATDTTLDRKVAIKVLPESFAQDVDRVARFEREAKTLASLNHNNIAQIHGLENREGVTAIVMELVEGPTLADRIAEGPIPPEEALRIARQIIDGLEAAHDKGIVHRDLKPANIKVKADGLVKILDFGIAKSVDSTHNSGRHTPTMITPAVTESGVIMGTAAYMSPEQARGKFVDERTDIWAFGCLLFEMLTGQPAFGGEDVTVTLARILERDTDMSSMPGMLSPAVRHTIKLCLQKDVKKRIADIRDVRLALDGRFESTEATAHGIATKPESLAMRLLPLSAMLVLGLLTAGLAVYALMQPAPAQVARFDVTPADQTIMSNSPSVAISPDGRSLAYLSGGVINSGGVTNAGADELRLRTLDSLESRALVTQGTLASPFFAPDGQEIGYYDNREPRLLKRVSIQGGAASSIATIDGSMRGASWGADGSIIFATNNQTSGLWRVSALGGEPEALTTPTAGEGDHLFPEILPGGEVVLFEITGTTDDESTIAALSLASGEQTIIQRGGSFPRYSSTGHLVFGREGVLWAVGFDAATLATRGSPVPVQEGVLTKGADAATEVSLAANGTLAYVAGSGGLEDRGLLFVAANGEEQVVLQSAAAATTVSLSLDGTHAALSENRGNLADISILDLTRPGSSLPLTRSALFNRNPIFSPDGRRVAWGSGRDGAGVLLVQNADGSGQAETLAVIDASIVRVIPTAWRQDATGMALVAVTLINNEGRRSIGVVSVGEPESFRPLGSTQFNQQDAALSPDGRWIAYASNDKGFDEVYVERFPEGGARQAVSIGGGRFPRWTQDGQTLTYLKLLNGIPISVERVRLSGGAGPDAPLVVAPPVELFPWRYYSDANSHALFDMSADGERFLVISAGPIGRTAEIPRTILVQNWAEELKRLVPVE